MIRHSMRLAVSASCGLLSITFSPASLSQGTGIEVFLGGALPDEGTRIEITIDRWTTEEEREALLEVLAEDGSDEAVKYVGQQGSSAQFLINDDATYNLRYARESVIGDIRQVALATDEPVSITLRKEPEHRGRGHVDRAPLGRREQRGRTRRPGSEPDSRPGRINCSRSNAHPQGQSSS